MRVGRGYQHDATRFEDTRAFLQQAVRIAQVFNDFDQRDCVEGCISELRLFQITGKNCQSGGARGLCRVCGGFDAFSGKAEVQC